MGSLWVHVPFNIKFTANESSDRVKTILRYNFKTINSVAYASPLCLVRGILSFTPFSWDLRADSTDEIRLLKLRIVSSSFLYLCHSALILACLRQQKITLPLTKLQRELNHHFAKINMRSSYHRYSSVGVYASPV